MLTVSNITKPKIDISLYGTDSNIAPIDKVHMMDEDSFELFAVEWLYGSKKGQYSSIAKIGGAGDKGRDVIAQYPDGNVDYYQCKHYNSALMPSDYYLELGKLCYYTYTNDIPLPQKYYIVASNDLGPTLQGLLNDPAQLRQNLIDNWETYCKKKITKTVEVQLDEAFSEYIKEFDFSIIEHYPIAKVIDEHLETVYGNIRFGGQRLQPPPNLSPSVQIEPQEMRYIAALLEAYSDELGLTIDTVNALEGHSQYFKHFARQRKDYYKAESIRRFVRDTLTDSQQFDVLKNEVYDGIIDVHEQEYNSGYQRLVEDLKQAALVNTAKSLLDSRLHFIGAGERKGVCHILANESRLKWVNNENE